MKVTTPKNGVNNGNANIATITKAITECLFLIIGMNFAIAYEANIIING